MTEESLEKNNQYSNQRMVSKIFPEFLGSILNLFGKTLSVCLSEDDASGTRFAAKGTDARLIGKLITVGLGNAANGHFELFLDLGLDLG